MPRGDTTRGAGLSTYYEPRLLSSFLLFYRGSPSTPPPLSFSCPRSSANQRNERERERAPFIPRYSPSRSLVSLACTLSSLVFIPNVTSRIRPRTHTYSYTLYKRTRTTCTRECVWPKFTRLRARDLPSISLAIPLVSGRLLSGPHRIERTLKLRRQANKLTHIVRDLKKRLLPLLPFASLFFLFSLLRRLSSFSCGATLNEKERVDKRKNQEKRMRGVLLNGRLGGLERERRPPSWVATGSPVWVRSTPCSDRVL